MEHDLRQMAFDAGAQDKLAQAAAADAGVCTCGAQDGPEHRPHSADCNVYQSTGPEQAPEAEALSNCCGAPFTHPGWPDSDVCSRCKEHADLDTVEEAAARLLHATLVEASWKSRNQGKEPLEPGSKPVTSKFNGMPLGRPQKPQKLKVSSIGDLHTKAFLDPRYHELALIAATNLGGEARTLGQAIQVFNNNASEGVGEEGVVDEINFCADLVGKESMSDHQAQVRQERLSKEFQKRLAARSQRF